VTLGKLGSIYRGETPSAIKAIQPRSEHSVEKNRHESHLARLELSSEQRDGTVREYRVLVREDRNHRRLVGGRRENNEKYNNPEKIMPEHPHLGPLRLFSC